MGRTKELRIDSLLRRDAVLRVGEIIGQVDDIVVQKLLGISWAHGKS